MESKIVQVERLQEIIQVRAGLTGLSSAVDRMDKMCEIVGELLAAPAAAQNDEQQRDKARNEALEEAAQKEPCTDAREQGHGCYRAVKAENELAALKEQMRVLTDEDAVHEAADALRAQAEALQDLTQQQESARRQLQAELDDARKTAESAERKLAETVAALKADWHYSDHTGQCALHKNAFEEDDSLCDCGYDEAALLVKKALKEEPHDR